MVIYRLILKKNEKNPVTEWNPVTGFEGFIRLIFYLRKPPSVTALSYPAGPCFFSSCMDCN